MHSRAKWAIAGVVTLSATAAVLVTIYRQSEIDRLSRACAEASRKQAWPRLESLSREWTTIDSSPIAWYWLGSALKAQGRFLEAEPAFAQIQVDGPRGIDAAVARMEIQFHVHKRPLAAIDLARDLLERDQKLASPRRHLIYFFAMTLQRTELIREIRQAIKFGVDVREHYLYLMILEDLSFRDAELITREWAEACPESAELRIAHQVQQLRLARLEMREDPSPVLVRRYEEIRSRFLEQFEQLSTNPQVLDTRLLLATDDSDVTAAGHCLERVTDNAAEDPVFWRYRGWYATHTGDLEDAEKSYRRAIELHPLGVQSRAELSGVLRRLGQAEEAGRMQELAFRGTAIVLKTRHLNHLRDGSISLLRTTAEFAGDCGDQEVASGILRRIDNPVPSPPH